MSPRMTLMSLMIFPFLSFVTFVDLSSFPSVLSVSSVDSCFSASPALEGAPEPGCGPDGRKNALVINPLMEDVRVLLALGLEEARQPTLDAAERMIHDDVASRHLDGELDHRRAAGRHGDGLGGRRRAGCQRGGGVRPVEHLADDVERRSEVRAAHTEEATDCLADLGIQRVLVLRQRASRSVEDEV